MLNYARKTIKTLKLSKLAKSIFLTIISRRIMFGTFAGMKYINENVCSGWLPKIFGSYEYHIQNILSQALSLLPVKPLVFDIGAAEGFYSVGLATKGARVISWELTANGVGLQKKLAALNNVSEFIDIRSECDISNLSIEIQKQTPNILIMDVEGSESHLISPDILKFLSKSIIIIELHGQTATQNVMSSFDKLGYSYSIIYQPSIDDWRNLSWMPSFLRRNLLDEARGNCCGYLVYSGGHNINLQEYF